MTVNMDRMKNLVEKLQRLSKSSNVHEAALAASRMQEILLKYNLTLSDIELEKDDVERDGHALGGSSCEQIWRGRLHERLAKHNFCRSVRFTGTRRMAVIGKRHNIEVVAYMYDSLSTTIWRLAKESAASEFGKELSGRYSYLNSFADGAVTAIDNRLQAERDAIKSKDVKCRDLIVVQDALVKKKFEADFPKIGMHRPAGKRDYNGYLRGHQAGKSIGLRKGVEQRTPGKQVH